MQDLIPPPQQNESQADFADRCHVSMGDGHSTDSKNAVCFQTWRMHKGVDSLDQTAVQRFSNGDFVQVKDVPVFTEHTTTDSDGNMVVYDRNALEAIAERCNERIEDTGDFSPITDGHTPDREASERGVPMPEVLGYAGPYRLGRVGNKNPRWAIFADEWWHKDDVQKLKKLRRRSPEVWLEDRMEDRFFDPIAALGAETPRLDMGMTRFARTGDGREVAKYTAAAPSAFSVDIKDEIDVREGRQDYDCGLPHEGDGETKKKDYGVNPWLAAGMGALAGNMLKKCPPCPGDTRFRSYQASSEDEADDDLIENYHAGEEGMALSPDDVQNIVDAIEQLDWVSWVKDQMANEPQPAGEQNQLAPDQGPEGPDPNMQGMEVPPAPPAVPAPPQPVEAPAAPPMNGNGQEPQPLSRKGYQAEGDDDEIEISIDADDDDDMDMYSAEDDILLGDGEDVDIDIDLDDESEEYRSRRYQSSSEGSVEGERSGKPSESGDVAATDLMKFSKLRGSLRKTRSSYAKLRREHAGMQERLQKIENEKVTAQRFSRLQSLAMEYSLDLVKESDRSGAMTEEQFEDHLDVIAENYSRIPLADRTPQLFAPDLTPDTAKTAKYQKENADKAVAHCLRERSKGNNISYAEAIEAVGQSD